MKLSKILFLPTLLFIGCATGYQAQSAWSGEGYQEIVTAPDTFLVTFRGNSFTSSEMVYQYALKRAAELTLKNGYQYFEVISSVDRTHGYDYVSAQQESEKRATVYKGTIQRPGITLSIKCSQEKEGNGLIEAIYFLQNNPG